VTRETVSLRECVQDVVMAIRQSPEGHLRFKDLFEMGTSKRWMVVTFLAILNLIKLGAIRIFQSDVFSDIELLGNQVIYDGNFNNNINDEYDSPAVDEDPGSPDLYSPQAPDPATTH